MRELRYQRLCMLLGNSRLRLSKSTRAIRDTITKIVRNHEEFSDS